MFKKKITLLLIFGVSVFYCFAQKDNFRDIPHIQKINSDTAIARTEVTIEEWMFYIADNNFDESLFPDSNKISKLAKIVFNDLKRKDGFVYLQSRSSTFKSYHYTFNPSGKIILPNKKSFKQLLLTDTNFFSLDIPVTGVTFEQAKRFCIWKEKQINYAFNYKLKVSLPSASLYNRIIENKDSLNLKKCALYNYKYCKCLIQTSNKDHKSQGKCLLDVYYYFPSNLRIYNLQGNASEMTNVKGIAKGGSFRHYAKESLKDNQQEYKDTEDWLGFRYIITVQ